MHLRHILRNCGQTSHCRRSSRGTTIPSSFRRPASRMWLYITEESSLRMCDKSCSLRLSKIPALSYRATSCSFPILTAMFSSIEFFSTYCLIKEVHVLNRCHQKTIIYFRREVVNFHERKKQFDSVFDFNLYIYIRKHTPGSALSRVYNKQRGRVLT